MAEDAVEGQDEEQAQEVVEDQGEVEEVEVVVLEAEDHHLGYLQNQKLEINGCQSYRSNCPWAKARGRKRA